MTSACRAALPGALRDRAQGIVARLLAAQLGVALALAAGLGWWAGGDAAHAVLVGALVAIVPNWFLAARLKRRARGATPVAALYGLYTGELLKIVFTAALFVIAIRLLDAAFPLVLATYCAMVAVNWFALLVVDLGEGTAARPAHGGLDN
jgi:ATP synthase protein I